MLNKQSIFRISRQHFSYPRYVQRKLKKQFRFVNKREQFANRLMKRKQTNKRFSIEVNECKTLKKPSDFGTLQLLYFQGKESIDLGMKEKQQIYCPIRRTGVKFKLMKLWTI